MKSGQKGFTVVETLLVLILISIVGFTGYYVYHSKNNANSTYNNATDTASNTPVATSSANKFVFKEIGVQINLPSDMKDLTYTVFNSDSGSSNLALSTPEFEKALNKCDPTTVGDKNSAFIVISKQTSTFNQDENPGVGNLKQFKGFWISGTSPNGIICADSNTQAEKDNFFTVFHKNISDIENAFKTATQVQ